MLAAETYESLGALLSDALVRFKGETALIEVDRRQVKRVYGYRDAYREVARIARFFADAFGALERPARIAIVLGNQSRWLLAACAAFRVGAIVVPIDYKLSPDEQLALLAHARVDVLVTELPLLRRFAQRPPYPTLLVDGDPVADHNGTSLLAWDALPQAPMPALVAREPNDVATIVYSSGTSGRPKGCLLPHRAYLAQLQALMELYPLRPGHRSFSILPTNHAIDFMVGFLGPFACGATVVHQRTLRPEFLLSTLEEHAITHMAVVPVLLEAFERAIDERLSARPKWQRGALEVLATLNESLTREAPRPSLSRRLLPGIHRAFGGRLEVMFAGGAFVDRARAERFYALGLPVAIGYGLTECCTVATVQDLRPFRADSVGRPVPGVELKIVPLSGETLDRDGVGEVWIRGPTVMLGYLDDPELTAETLTPDGWLRTGDLGWLDASRHLHLVGRVKNMIVTPGGKNVYPEDVEGAFEGLSGIEEFCVMASGFVWPRRSDVRDEVLFAVVRPAKHGAEPAALAREITARNRRLPEHKRIGAFLLWGEPFPRTASTKLKRQDLAARLREATSPRGPDWHELDRPFVMRDAISP